MKHIFTFFAVAMMALAIPQSVKAYDFSAVAPSGQTLYYNFYLLNDSLVYVTFPSSGSFFNYVSGALTIPSTVTYNGNTYTVTSIGYNAFSNCTGLTSVVIPSTVTSINGNAFMECSNLTSANIPEGITTIGGMAFYYCSSLTTPNTYW